MGGLESGNRKTPNLLIDTNYTFPHVENDEVSGLNSEGLTSSGRAPVVDLFLTFLKGSPTGKMHTQAEGL